MSTPIQEVPAVVLPAPFPTTADRVAGQYNTKAKAWADKEAEMAQSLYSISLVTYNNAIVATEQAQEAKLSAQFADSSRQQALVEISTAKQQALQELEQTGADIVAEVDAARDDAQQFKNEAAASAAAAQGTLNYKGEWSALGGPLAPPATVSHDLQLWSLVLPTSSVQSDEPGVSNKWIIVREQAPIGTIYTGAQTPKEGVWLELETQYLKSSYPDLAEKLGSILSCNGIVPVAVTWPFPGQTQASAAVYPSGGGLLAVTSAYQAPWLFIARSQNDGVSWTASSVPTQYQSEGSVVHMSGNGIDVILRSGNGYASLRSVNGGAAWTTVPSPSSVEKGLFVNDTFYAWNSAQCFTSKTANGAATWQSSAITLDGNSATGLRAGSIAYSQNLSRFFAAFLVSGGSKIATSSDGANWQTSLAITGPTYPVIAAGPAGILCAGDTGGVSKLFFTQDAVNWSKRDVLAGDLEVTSGSYALAAERNFLVVSSTLMSVIDEELNFVTSKAAFSPSQIRNLIGDNVWLSPGSGVLQKAPIWDYDRTTQFRTPARSAGVFGVNQWIKGK